MQSLQEHNPHTLLIVLFRLCFFIHSFEPFKMHYFVTPFLHYLVSQELPNMEGAQCLLSLRGPRCPTDITWKLSVTHSELHFPLGQLYSVTGSPLLVAR